MRKVAGCAVLLIVVSCQGPQTADEAKNFPMMGNPKIIKVAALANTVEERWRLHAAQCYNFEGHISDVRTGAFGNLYNLQMDQKWEAQVRKVGGTSQISIRETNTHKLSGEFSDVVMVGEARDIGDGQSEVKVYYPFAYGKPGGGLLSAAKGEQAYCLSSTYR